MSFLDKIKRNNTYYWITLLILFLILSFLVVLPFWMTGFLYSGPDLQFHTSRIQEIYENMKSGSFIPGIATHTFNQIGDMVVASYPWVTLYPFALLMFIVKPVSAFYLGTVFYIFITLLISYISMNGFTNNKKLAVYFSILYGYSSFFIMNFMNIEMGTALSYAFLPMSFYGLYLIMLGNYRKWYILTIGVTGILYSHTPSTLIILFTLTILYIVLFRYQLKSERTKRFFYLLCSGMVSILLSLIVWIPIIVLLSSNKVSVPRHQILTIWANDIGDILFGSFTFAQNSGFYNGIGATITLVLIFGWIFLKQMNHFAKFMYLSGVITVIITSTIFPWYIIHYIPIINIIESIQLTNRIYPVAILFLAVFGAYLLYYFDHKNNYYKYISSIILIATVIFNVFFVNSILNNNANVSNGGLKNEVNLNYKSNYYHQVPKTSFYLQNYKVNNDSYDNQFGDEDASGTTDYLPVKAVENNSKTPVNGGVIPNGSILGHNLNFGHNFLPLQSNNIVAGINKMTYQFDQRINAGTEVDVPFVYYKGFNYLIIVNGKGVTFHQSNRGTFIFKMPTTSDHNRIEILYRKSNLINFATFISIISWVGLIVYIFYSLIKKVRRGAHNEIIRS